MVAPRRRRAGAAIARRVGAGTRWRPGRARRVPYRFRGVGGGRCATHHPVDGGRLLARRTPLHPRTLLVAAPGGRARALRLPAVCRWFRSLVGSRRRATAGRSRQRACRTLACGRALQQPAGDVRGVRCTPHRDGPGPEDAGGSECRSKRHFDDDYDGRTERNRTARRAGRGPRSADHPPNPHRAHRGRPAAPDRAVALARARTALGGDRPGAAPPAPPRRAGCGDRDRAGWPGERSQPAPCGIGSDAVSERGTDRDRLPSRRPAARSGGDRHTGRHRAGSMGAFRRRIDACVVRFQLGSRGKRGATGNVDCGTRDRACCAGDASPRGGRSHRTGDRAAIADGTARGAGWHRSGARGRGRRADMRRQRVGAACGPPARRWPGCRMRRTPRRAVAAGRGNRGGGHRRRAPRTRGGRRARRPHGADRGGLDPGRWSSIRGIHRVADHRSFGRHPRIAQSSSL